MTKPIYDISPFTLLDYPNKSACILWFTGCNMRCLYCYNPDIVLGKGKMGIEDALHSSEKEGPLTGGGFQWRRMHNAPRIVGIGAGS